MVLDTLGRALTSETGGIMMKIFFFVPNSHEFLVSNSENAVREFSENSLTA